MRWKWGFHLLHAVCFSILFCFWRVLGGGGRYPYKVHGSPSVVLLFAGGGGVVWEG